MQIEGSCHCGKVHYRATTHTPHPYNLCYCSRCRKTSGGGGFSINLGAESQGFEVTGKEYVKVYRAVEENPKRRAEDGLTFTERNFCGECGSQL